MVNELEMRSLGPDFVNVITSHSFPLLAGESSLWILRKVNQERGEVELTKNKSGMAGETIST